MALGKKGNIVAETIGFLSMFICFHVSGNIVAEQNLLPMKQKMFIPKSQEITFLRF